MSVPKRSVTNNCLTNCDNYIRLSAKSLGHDIMNDRCHISLHIVKTDRNESLKIAIQWLIFRLECHPFSEMAQLTERG